MLVALDLIGNRLGPFVDHPRKRVPEEETMGRVEACDHLMLCPLVCLFEGLVSHHDASEIGDVLPLRQFAVDMEGIDRAIFVVLFDDHPGSRIKLCAVLRLPPVVQVSLVIVLASLVVKSMCDLMTEGR